MPITEKLDRLSNLNGIEIEVIRCVCLARDGYLCFRCRKTVQELIIEDRIMREIKGLKQRDKPVLVINHKDGTKNSHSSDGTYFGNVELVCYPCNALYKAPEVDYHPDEIRTYASRKSHSAYVQWVYMVNNYLTKFEDACLARLANKYSKTIKCSQDALIKYAKREHETRWNVYKRPECDYDFCAGIHICFWGKTPKFLPPLDEEVAQHE